MTRAIWSRDRIAWNLGAAGFHLVGAQRHFILESISWACWYWFRCGVHGLASFKAIATHGVKMTEHGTVCRFPYVSGPTLESAVCNGAGRFLACMCRVSR
jgi:hypothetical protein